MACSPSPVRDPSGYRRYDARAVADLIRIKTFAAAGVPLDRIRRLLGSDRAQFAAAVAEIDLARQQRIGDLEDLRQELAALKPADRLVLPPEAAELLDKMRVLGVGERTMTVERDGWTLLMALAPAQVPAWAAHTSTGALPDFQRLYLAWEEASESWTPTIPACPSRPPRAGPGWPGKSRARRHRRAIPVSRLSIPAVGPSWIRRHRRCAAWTSGTGRPPATVSTSRPRPPE